MSSLSTLPKGDSAWLLRKSIQRIMQQVSVLETNIGSSTTGNSSNGQVIFNDNGVLRGDAGLTYNKTTDLLSVGAATITGNLTVDTNTLFVDSANDRVGIGTATPNFALLEVIGGDMRMSLNQSLYLYYGSATNYASLRTDNSGNVQVFTGLTSPANRFQIANDGVCTWSNVGGVAGTAMTLNSTGLGVGASPANDKLLSLGSMGILLSGATSDFSFRNSGGTAIQRLRYTDATGALTIGSAVGTAYPVELGGSTSARAVTIDASSNVGIGVTPSAGWRAGARALQLGAARFASLHEATNGSANLAFGAYESGSNAYSYTTTGDAPSRYSLISGRHEWFTAPSGTAGNAITFTQAMTLDASGNLLVGTTGTVVSSVSRFRVSANAAPAIDAKNNSAPDAVVDAWNSATSGNNTFHRFWTEAAITLRGSIDYDRAGGLVRYNTTSDYRAKNIIGPVSNSGSLIDSLKVYVGKMHGATIERPMLIAHEAQEVAPYAVTGTKDEVDTDGNPKYQQMDVSALVPLLIAEIQSLRARVQTLETR